MEDMGKVAVDLVALGWKQFQELELLAHVCKGAMREDTASDMPSLRQYVRGDPPARAPVAGDVLD